MRNYWSFQCGGSVLFGPGVIREIPRLLKQFNAKKCLIISDPGVAKAGIVETVQQVVAQAGWDPLVFQEAIPEPTMSSVLKAYDRVESYQPDLFIGLGGGSCMDLAKMLSLLLTHGGHPSDYFGENQVPGPIKPVIAIPTTAGTGSEVSPVAIVTDEETNLKVGLSDNHLRPAVALLDPRLTLKLPAYITACTGIDALSQAIEAYFAKDYRYIDAEGPLIYQGSNPMSDLFAKRAIELISKNLPIAVHQGNHVEARSNMLLGNLFSAVAFTNSGTSLIHALSYPIAEISKRAHGEIIGALLPYIMSYNTGAAVERFSDVAECLGETIGEDQAENARKSTEAVFRILKEIGLPYKLSQLGIQREQIPLIVSKALSIGRLIRINPKTPRQEDVENLLYTAF